VINKSYASAFYGTDLLSRLVRGGHDSVIIVGNSTSGCVRATAIDAQQNGFNVVLPQECVFDRIEASHKIALMDCVDEVRRGARTRRGGVVGGGDRRMTPSEPTEGGRAMTHDLVIANGTVVTPELGAFEADVAADGDEIAAIASSGTLSGDRVIDAEGSTSLPGAIDPHTHHGIYRGLEADAETESRSDLVGGVTTIGNYFRRGGSYEEIMEGYFAEAEPNYYHDYFFSLGLLSFEHIEEIPYIVEELGITSFKWYKNYKDVAPEKFGTDSDARRLGGRVHSGARRAGRAHDARPPLREHGDHERARRQPVPRLRGRRGPGVPRLRRVGRPVPGLRGDAEHDRERLVSPATRRRRQLLRGPHFGRTDRGRRAGDAPRGGGISPGRRVPTT